jgi:3',5'-cyclic AMP phosphodiesterase CpdA
VRKVAHVSDLHFGRTDARMVEQLRSHLVELRPDLMVVSGDLTQRARISEFAEARAFLDSIPAPRIVVPGNHDIALYNVYKRFVGPLRNYRRHISEDVEPFYADAELLALSVNTARSLTFKGGRINQGQVSQVRERLMASSPEVIKILVAHHPLDLPETIRQPLAGRARSALGALAKCGIDLILSGHLHVSRFAAPAEGLRIGGHTALLVQAGTAVSTRGRGELNSFNVIETSEDRITVHQRCWSPADDDFTQCRTGDYRRTAEGWAGGMTS